MGFSHWNYRVVEDIAAASWRICEIFYDGDEVIGWTDAHAPEGFTLDDLHADFENQKNCLYEIHYHVLENEDGDEKLVPWREDGSYGEE